MAAALWVSGFVPSNVALSALLLSFLANVFLATLLLTSPPSAQQTTTTTTDPTGNVRIGRGVLGDCGAAVGGSGGGGEEAAAAGEAASASAAAAAAAAAWQSTLQVEGGVVEDPWFISKAVPPPDDCKCAGFVIERLEPEYNFRRAFALGFDPDLETKVHLLPYLRASQDLSLRAAKRRILIDLGGKSFDTSVTWFLQYYPLDFTEVHVFEARKGIFRVPDAVPVPLLAASGSSTGGSNGLQGQLMSNITSLMDSFSVVRRDPYNTTLQGPFPFPAWELSRIHLYECFVGIVGDDLGGDDDGGKGTTPSPERKGGSGCKVNVTRFIKEKLKVTPEDTLIVKMDVDGVEWDILPLWVSDTGNDGAGGIGSSMVELVDELFVEVHYHHPTMNQYHWTRKRFPHTMDETTQLLRDMRSRGFFVHAWP